MIQRYTPVIILFNVFLLILFSGCSEQPEKPVDRQIEQKYGKTVAQASMEFKALSPKDEAFYKGGGKMHLVDALLPSVKMNMSRDEVELLFGQPSSLKETGDEDYWHYTLFYSSAITFAFDEKGNLIGVDGYGVDKWEGKGLKKR